MRCPTVAFVTNSTWTLGHFRIGLMEAAQAAGARVLALGPPDGEEYRILDAGLEFRGVPFNLAGMNPAAEARTALALYRFYREERPDLVHHFSTKAVIYGSLAARAARVPRTVNTITGRGVSFLEPGRTQELVSVLYRAALGGPGTLTTFQNPEDRAFFVERRLVRRSATELVLGSGVDPRRYRPPPRGPGEGPVRFLMFSRMMWAKGVREYLDAADAVGGRLGDGPDGPTFTLLGGAPPGNPTNVHPEWLENPDTISGDWLEERTARSVAAWLPHDDDVVRHLDGADVAVLPSYYPEGLPRSLLEAMGCGKALVTTDSPGCREVVVPGENGLLVPRGDARALADALERLARDPQGTRARGRRSRELLLERFSDEVVIERTFALYRRLGLAMGERPRPATLNG